MNADTIKAAQETINRALIAMVSKSFAHDCKPVDGQYWDVNSCETKLVNLRERLADAALIVAAID